jgi:predicted metal-dependent hydrolase
MSVQVPDQIHVDGETFALIIERKRVKNVNARLRGSTVFVSAPPTISEKDLKPMVEKLAGKLIRRAHSQRINEEDDALALAGKVARRFLEPPEVDRVLFVTNQRSRWGSYSGKTRTIRLNAALRSMPKWVLEAVIAHELAHVAHPNHSQEFWALLREVCPETEKANAFLAGVSWLGHNWQRLSPAEQELLISDGERNGRTSA